jgi:hypothetical protein
MLEDEIGNVRIIIETQSGWRPNKDMKMSSVPSFWAPGSLIFVVVASYLKKGTLYQPAKANSAWRTPKNHMKKKMLKFLEYCQKDDRTGEFYYEPS